MFEFTNPNTVLGASLEHNCHVYFYNAFDGNSVTWHYVAQTRDSAPAVTWSAPYIAANVSEPTKSGGGLTVAASAAIGLGAAFGVFLIVLVTFCLWWNRRRKRGLRPWQRSQPLQQPLPGSDSPPPYQPRGTQDRQEFLAVQEVEAVPEVPRNLVLAPELSSSGSTARRPNTSELADSNSRSNSRVVPMRYLR